MVSFRDEEIQIRILKASLRQSDKRAKRNDQLNERLMEILQKKTAQTGQAHQRVKELEERDVEKTKTIRSLKRRIKKPRE